jgi:hypothetical protein
MNEQESPSVAHVQGVAPVLSEEAHVSVSRTDVLAQTVTRWPAADAKTLIGPSPDELHKLNSIGID